MLLKPVGVVAHRVDAALELLALAAELVEQPRDHLFGIRAAHVHVMQAEQLRILHDLDARAPRVFDERQLEEAGHVARRRGDLDAGRLELLHLRVEIGDREADVIDGAAGARLGGRRCLRNMNRVLPNMMRSGASVMRLPPNVLLVPGRRRGRVRHVEVDVIVGQRRRLRAGRATAHEANARTTRDSGHQGAYRSRRSVMAALLLIELDGCWNRYA